MNQRAWSGKNVRDFRLLLGAFSHLAVLGGYRPPQCLHQRTRRSCLISPKRRRRSAIDRQSAQRADTSTHRRKTFVCIAPPDCTPRTPNWTNPVSCSGS